MSSWILQTPGLLPWALLINAGLSWYNTFNAYFNPAQVRQLYEGPNNSQVTPLSMRTFGTWTILSGSVRFYAAYNITVPQIYALVFWAYVAIVLHWTLETVVFKTTKWGVAMAMGMGIDVGLLVWIVVQWGNYVEGN